MTTMYVVTSGAYSDYMVHGVYSTKERARAAADYIGWDGQVEEYDLDYAADPLLQGFRLLEVYIDRDGEAVVRKAYPSDAFHVVPGRWSFGQFGDERVQMRGYVWARDEAHAIKIANDERAMAIAEGRWKDG